MPVTEPFTLLLRKLSLGCSVLRVLKVITDVQGLLCLMPLKYKQGIKYRSFDPKGPISSTYRTFSIKRTRHLFKMWPQGPVVYLKPAFNRSPAFTNEVLKIFIIF